MGRARQPRQTPSHEFDPAIEELTTAFATVSAMVAAAISAEATDQIVSAGIGGLGRLDDLAQDVAIALGSLLSVSEDWTRVQIPIVYRRGSEGAFAAIEGTLEDDREPGEEREEHDVAIQAARSKIDGELKSAVEGMASDANAELQKIRARTVARALAQDSPLGNRLAEDFSDQMRERGITFRDKSGREWQPEAYARMVLRTNVASTLNAGHLNKALELGSRYVRVFDGGPGDVDEPCRIANGQVWHILVAALNMLEHPNCRRSFAALDPSYSGPVDRDMEIAA